MVMLNKKRAPLIVFAIFVVSVFFAGAYILLIKNQPLKTQVSHLFKRTSEELTQTSQPFEDITIPYLQARTYSSSLGEREQLSTHTAYTSYLTHYLSDGYTINALLAIPKGETPQGGWPAIVFIHGYIPPSLYQTQTRYVDYINYLASNGFVVLKIDLRGHGDSEGEASGAYYSGDYIVDVLNAYAALQSADFVNKNRIGLWGHSMAGNVVLRSVAAQKNIPAVVIWAGAVYTYADLQEYRINDNSYRPPSSDSNRQRRRQELFDTHGQFDASNEFWKRVPATNYLQDFQTAIQIHHAIDDNVVSIKYSHNLADILKKAGKKYELYEYSSGGHNITGANFGVAMQRTVSFFQEKL